MSDEPTQVQQVREDQVLITVSYEAGEQPRILVQGRRVLRLCGPDGSDHLPLPTDVCMAHIGELVKAGLIQSVGQRGPAGLVLPAIGSVN